MNFRDLYAPCHHTLFIIL